MVQTGLAGFFLPKYTASHCKCENPSRSPPS